MKRVLSFATIFSLFGLVVVIGLDVYLFFTNHLVSGGLLGVLAVWVMLNSVLPAVEYDLERV